MSSSTSTSVTTARTVAATATNFLGGSAAANDDCGCNDYSLLTANTGIRTVTTANGNLDGSGTTVTVFTAGGANGSIVRSITIKSIQPTLQGMVRLFIANADSSVITLYKEVQIPIVPQAPSQAVPAPQYIMYETVLCGDIKLNDGFSIIATTQNTQSFNIIVEGLDISYPSTLPGSCCNFKQTAANTGVNTVSLANTALDGSGTNFSTVFTVGSRANGSLIKAITIKAMQSTHEGAVRIFLSPSGTPAWTLLHEVYIPQTTQSGFDPSFKHVIPANFNLQEGYQIGVTTQIAESFSVTVEAEDWTYPIS